MNDALLEVQNALIRLRAAREADESMQTEQVFCLFVFSFPVFQPILLQRPVESPKRRKQQFMNNLYAQLLRRKLVKPWTAKSNVKGMSLLRICLIFDARSHD